LENHYEQQLLAEKLSPPPSYSIMNSGGMRDTARLFGGELMDWTDVLQKCRSWSVKLGPS